MVGHKKLFLGIVSALFMVCGHPLSAMAVDAQVDLVVFSKDRPLQLYALLESSACYITGINKVVVIYCASGQNFDDAYSDVKQAFPTVDFIKQSDNPRADFKNITNAVVFGLPSPYILFAVDDIIVIDHVNLNYCIKLLEEKKAYGFYLRLGSDITECYAERKHTGNPPLKVVTPDVYAWRFYKAQGDWAYPHTVDMTLYRKKDIKNAFMTMHYSTPNTLEGAWACRVGDKMKFRGLCFAASKIVNLPLNLVQADYLNNRCAGIIDPQALLVKFNEGLKIDIASMYRLPHSAPHVEYMPTFTAR